MQNVTRFLRPPARRVAIRVAIVALLVAAICWYFGADVWHSILLGSVVTIVGVISHMGTALDVSDTRWRSGGQAEAAGSRDDVAQMSWLLQRRYGRVDGAAVRRVRRIAVQRLALQQLDLLDLADRPKIEELIGPRSYAILVRGESRPPLLRSLLGCLDALDALDPARSATPRPRSRRRVAIIAPRRSRRTRER